MLGEWFAMIFCPKCGHEHWPVGIHEEDYGEQDCESCGFKFVVDIEYDPTYSVSCLDHDWEVKESPSLRKYQQCQHCFAVRPELTNENDTSGLQSSD